MARGEILRIGEEMVENILVPLDGSELSELSLPYGLYGAKRWFLGSVTYKVLHTGKTPLLLVRAIAR